MAGYEKKTCQVVVKIGENSLTTLQRAASRRWPGIEVGKSTALRLLAETKAKELLGEDPDMPETASAVARKGSQQGRSGIR